MFEDQKSLLIVYFCLTNRGFVKPRMFWIHEGGSRWVYELPTLGLATSLYELTSASGTTEYFGSTKRLEAFDLTIEIIV